MVAAPSQVIHKLLNEIYTQSIDVAAKIGIQYEHTYQIDINLK